MSKEYLNASLAPEKRAQALLEEMSLEEKAAQLTGVFPFDEEYKDFDGISKRVPHGIGEVSTLEMRRMETLEEVAAWQKKVQEIVMENSEHCLLYTSKSCIMEYWRDFTSLIVCSRSHS